MLSSLIPCLILLIIKYIELVINNLKFSKVFKNTFITILALSAIFYFINFKNYFFYPQQDYRSAISFIQKDNSNFIIRASDGTSPGASLYIGEEISFGPGLNFSSQTVKSEIINLSKTDLSKVNVIYSMYIENERDFSNLGFQNVNLVHPNFGNLFLGKWEKTK